MALDRIEGGVAPKERIIIYSLPGYGKTRLGLHLTERFRDILYYAADEGSEFLGSIMQKYKKHVTVLRPDRSDPIANFSEFCIHDWKKDFPDVRTLVVDTYSKIAQSIIQYSANEKMMTQEKHFQVGVPGTPGSQTIPNRGDYMAVQSISRNFLDLIFHHQRDMHIIFLMHEDISVVEGAGSVGGPAHPGRTMMMELPSKFNTVIRLTRGSVLNAGDGTITTVVQANTDAQGQYICRIREGSEGGNPMPQVPLKIDPINFWQLHDEHYAPHEEAALTPTEGV